MFSAEFPAAEGLWARKWTLWTAATQVNKDHLRAQTKISSATRTYSVII